MPGRCGFFFPPLTYSEAFETRLIQLINFMKISDSMDYLMVVTQAPAMSEALSADLAISNSDDALMRAMVNGGVFHRSFTARERIGTFMIDGIASRVPADRQPTGLTFHLLSSRMLQSPSLPHRHVYVKSFHDDFITADDTPTVSMSKKGERGAIASGEGECLYKFRTALELAKIKYNRVSSPTGSPLVYLQVTAEQFEWAYQKSRELSVSLVLESDFCLKEGESILKVTSKGRYTPSASLSYLGGKHRIILQISATKLGLIVPNNLSLSAAQEEFLLKQDFRVYEGIRRKFTPKRNGENERDVVAAELGPPHAILHNVPIFLPKMEAVAMVKDCFSVEQSAIDSGTQGEFLTYSLALWGKLIVDTVLVSPFGDMFLSAIELPDSESQALKLAAALGMAQRSVPPVDSPQAVVANGVDAENPC
jgi:hypothetical protein